MKTGIFAVLRSQKWKDRTAGPVFSGLGPVQLWSFSSLETGPLNTNALSSQIAFHTGILTLYCTMTCLKWAQPDQETWLKVLCKDFSTSGKCGLISLRFRKMAWCQVNNELPTIIKVPVLPCGCQGVFWLFEYLPRASQSTLGHFKASQMYVFRHHTGKSLSGFGWL